MFFGLSMESMDLWIHLRSPVRSFVRSFVRAHFPENPRIRIFWFFVLKKKVTISLFHRKFENGPFLAKNGPKLAFLAQNAQKWGVFSIFFSKSALEFPNFLQEA